MKTLTAQLQAQIDGGGSKTPEAEVAATIDLWIALAAKLVPIIGDDGFRPLVDRSIHLNSKTFPWLALDLKNWDHTDQFSFLKDSLATRNSTEAAAAALALLTTFVETLVELIDLPLVSNVLRSAWGNGITER